MLFFIGLGLGDEKDITVKGLEAVKSCEKVFLEGYTSILGVDKEALVYLPSVVSDRSSISRRSSSRRRSSLLIEISSSLTLR